MRSIVSALVIGAAFLAISASLAYARTQGWLSDETVKRTVQVMIGLGLAVYSNFTPKQIGAPGSPATEAWKQHVLRTTGWSLALAGLAYAALWAFAPIGVANIASIAVVATAMVVTILTVIRTAIACRTLGAG